MNYLGRGGNFLPPTRGKKLLLRALKSLTKTEITIGAFAQCETEPRKPKPKQPKLHKVKKPKTNRKLKIRFVVELVQDCNAGAEGVYGVKGHIHVGATEVAHLLASCLGFYTHCHYPHYPHYPHYTSLYLHYPHYPHYPHTRHIIHIHFLYIFRLTLPVS